MDEIYNILVGVGVLLFIISAVTWPFLEERDRKRFDKNDVKYNDGDNR
jgi:hypothetical protein